MFNPRTVVVTGGAGFIGSCYVRWSVREHPERRIVVLDKLTYSGNLDNLAEVKDAITFVHGDIADPAAVAQAMDGADAVVNFAAESHVDRSVMDPRPFVKTNVEGTLVLLEQARRQGNVRYLQVSTDEVYGDLEPDSPSSVEADILGPRSPYAATKAAADHLVLSYAITHKLDVVLTRGANTYGPYQYPEKIIPLFVTNAMEDRPLPLYGDGSAVRDYLYVEDHAAGIDTVLTRGDSGHVYNLGARSQINGRTVADTILRLLQKPEALKAFVTDRPGHDYRYSVDPAKAESLGWARQWTFDAGMAETIRWYTENTSWWRKVKNHEHFREHEKKWYVDRKS